MRVLILYASTGGGHKRSANALATLIKEKDPKSRVELVDCLEYVSHGLNLTVSEGYIQMAKNTPNLYGALYRSTNHDSMGKAVSRVFSRFNRKLLPLLAKFRPDVVVTTHAFPGEMISSLKEKYDLEFPIISIITDFAPHMAYVNKIVDAYIVSSDEMVDEMERYGISRSKVHSLGIPIDMSFYNNYDKNEIIEQLHLKPDTPIVLIMAGSFGVTDILKIYQNISKSTADFQIIVITGKNKKLYKAFEYMLGKKDDEDEKMRDIKEIINDITLLNSLSGSFKPSKSTKLIYFTNEVQKYMNISDLIVTKPGGLTVSEALASSLPMAIFKAIPGQEEENSDYLVKNNLAVKISKSDCEEIITELISKREKLESMKNSCKMLYKDKSAEQVYNLLVKMIEENEKTFNNDIV